MKPGGLLVIGGFARPDVSFGFSAEQLAKAYGALRVLRVESVTDTADWDRGNKRQLVRFVAVKARYLVAPCTGPTRYPTLSGPETGVAGPSEGVRATREGRRYEPTGWR